jgi:LysR family transcriptional regulator, regulator for bpeEF and oprC
MDRLWAMEVFVKVVETNSLSKAAAQLDLANASVTTCIRNLEMHLGVVLLHRSTRHLALTEDGRIYYDHCRSILGQVEEGESLLSSTGTRLRGTLRVELPIALGHLMLGPALLDFARQYPDLKVMVSLTNTVDSLVRRGIDVAIRMDEVDDVDLVARWIYETQHVICAAPGFLAEHGTPSHPTELNLNHCIGLIPALLNRTRPWEFSNAGENYSFVPAANLVFNSSDALLRTAARDGGFVYVLDVLAEDWLERGALTTVLQGWKTARTTFYAVYPQARFVAPKVRAFIEFLAMMFQTRPKPDSAMVPRILSR